MKSRWSLAGPLNVSYIFEAALIIFSLKEFIDYQGTESVYRQNVLASSCLINSCGRYFFQPFPQQPSSVYLLDCGRNS